MTNCMWKLEMTVFSVLSLPNRAFIKKSIVYKESVFIDSLVHVFSRIVYCYKVQMFVDIYWELRSKKEMYEIYIMSTKTHLMGILNSTFVSVLFLILKRKT